MNITTRLIFAKYIADACDAELFWAKASALLQEGASIDATVNLIGDKQY